MISDRQSIARVTYAGNPVAADAQNRLGLSDHLALEKLVWGSFNIPRPYLVRTRVESHASKPYLPETGYNINRSIANRSNLLYLKSPLKY